MITPPFAPEVLAEFPELAAFGRTATRLHPRRGTPGVGDSHVGGPLAWPADEPWPVCTRELRDGRRHARPNPLVPVAQLWASDGIFAGSTLGGFAAFGSPAGVHGSAAGGSGVHGSGVSGSGSAGPAGEPSRSTGAPGATGGFQNVAPHATPPGADLLQVLWCPVEHLREPQGPAVQVRWRRSADLPAELLTDPPQGDVERAGWIPTPCVLHPEQIVDHPCAGALPKALRDRMPHAVAAGFVAPGWKVGGYPRRPGELPCPRCGTPAELLLLITAREYDAESYHWIPLEEQDLDWSAPQGEALERPTGLDLDADVHVLACPDCPTTFVT